MNDGKDGLADHYSYSVYPEYLDGPFTGGFGEQSCHSCHFDYDINPADGKLAITGIEKKFKPGHQYNLKINLSYPDLEKGGFQMSARFQDGSQAGRFSWKDNRLMFTPSVSDEVQYLQHSREGTIPNKKGEISWEFTWTAPDDSDQPVIFNIAANAGNDDDSSFGDRIYVKEFKIDAD